MENEILKVVYKHYVLSKLMEVYGYILKDELPNNHIANKSEEVLKACKKFYSAFDKKIPIEEVEAVEEMSLQYFEAFDNMLSLNPDNFAIIANSIKELSQSKVKGEPFETIESLQVLKLDMTYVKDFLETRLRSPHSALDKPEDYKEIGYNEQAMKALLAYNKWLKEQIRKGKTNLISGEDALLFAERFKVTVEQMRGQNKFLKLSLTQYV